MRHAPAIKIISGLYGRALYLPPFTGGVVDQEALILCDSHFEPKLDGLVAVTMEKDDLVVRNLHNRIVNIAAPERCHMVFTDIDFDIVGI